MGLESEKGRGWGARMKNCVHIQQHYKNNICVARAARNLWENGLKSTTFELRQSYLHIFGTVW